MFHWTLQVPLSLAPLIMLQLVGRNLKDHVSPCVVTLSVTEGTRRGSQWRLWWRLWWWLCSGWYRGRTVCVRNIFSIFDSGKRYPVKFPTCGRLIQWLFRSIKGAGGRRAAAFGQADNRVRHLSIVEPFIEMPNLGISMRRRCNGWTTTRWQYARHGSRWRMSFLLLLHTLDTPYPGHLLPVLQSVATVKHIPFQTSFQRHWKFH